MFEIAFELSWKTLKDFLESEGFDTPTPRKTLQQAFQSGFIKQGHEWNDALNKRNLLTHTFSVRGNFFREPTEIPCHFSSDGFKDYLNLLLK